MQGSYKPRPLNDEEQVKLSQVSTLNAKLVKAERERDQLREVNCKLRDKLLEIAKECSECGGTGCITRIDNIAMPGRVEECPDCADIRSVLE